MNKIRKGLLFLLGERKYLALLASAFQGFYKTGLLGKGYQDIYFLKKIIQKGDYCIDIGAHLGYYTLEMSRLVRNSGEVYAVEPMSRFQETLRGLIRKNRVRNVVLMQVALGGDSEFVEMGIPEVGKMKKFGYARVMKTSTFLEYTETEKVKNESGDLLFAKLPRLDFIKCDVEGLEVSVFSSLMTLISRFRPVLLCELADKGERIKLFEMLRPAGYQIYLLHKNTLEPLDLMSDREAISHNHYFIPGERLEKVKHLVLN
jgi:FkbM family methyltransferase